MCGIFSWAGNDPKKFNRNKFNTLGIMNETRGLHSCGVTFDNKIFKGVGTRESQYRSFAAVNSNNKEFNAGLIPIVLGHTRHATVGAHTIHNCHPFGFYKDEEAENSEFNFIGVHNGSLKGNYKNLATARGINLTKQVESTYANTTTLTSRDKIDSELLLESIMRDGYTILDEYYGAAALVWYDTSEPNVIYCYHGKSYKTGYALNNKNIGLIEEERPMFYYQEQDGSLYLSSIKESLQVINDTGSDELIGQVEHNKVFKITDGNFDNAEVVYEVNRKNRAQGAPIPVYDGRSNTRNNAQQEFQYPSQMSLVKTKDFAVTKVNMEPIRKPRKNESHVIYSRMRFMRNGHLVTGIYVNIKDYGLYLVHANNVGEAYKILEQSIKDKRVFDTTNHCFKSLKLAISQKVEYIENPIPKTFKCLMLLEGILMKTALDFESIKAAGIRKYSTRGLSEASVLPLVSFNRNVTKSTIEVVYKDGDAFNGTFNAAPYSNYTYNVRKGALYSIVRNDVIDVTDSVKKLNAPDCKINSKKADIDEQVDVANTNDEVIEDVNKMFLNLKNSLPSFIEQMKKYENNELAESMVDCMEAMGEIIQEMDMYADLSKME